MLFKKGFLIFLSLWLFDVSPAATLLPLTGVSKIDAGGYHTCAALNTGGVQCWGRNYDGQIGDGTATSSLTPVAVTGLSSSVTAIAAGGAHTCAALNTGGVQCWGRNYDGQLGNGTRTDSRTPVAVTGLSIGVTAIAAGYDNYTCALLSTGKVQCWGNNVNGQLGNGTNTTKYIPYTVTELSGATAIAVDRSHTCAVLNTGGVKCWGNNDVGQLGDSSSRSSFKPVAVTELSGATAIAVGGVHTCAVLNTGEVRCWGANDAGQLGNDTTTNSSTPVAVTGLRSGVTAITAGNSHTCALLNTGEVRCWGANDAGQLGNDTTTNSRTPVAVTELSSGVTAIAADYNHTCALLNTGEVQCWGENNSGQLGNSRNVYSTIPVFVVINGYTLTLDQTGPGSGTMSGGGNFTAGAMVKLTATPDAGSTFVNWTPAPCAESFVMPNNNLKCTAHFEGATLAKYTVIVNQSGTGTGTVSGGGDFAVGATVDLTATPNAGSTFEGWTPAPCAVRFVMPNNALTCTATFTLEGTSSPDNCDAQHAVFDLATGVVTIPAVDIPILDPLTGTTTGTFAVFRGQLQLTTGIGDFQFVSSNFNYVNKIDHRNECHAQYTYADNALNQGGLLHLPFLEVPSVMVVPPDTQVPGPTQVFEVTLRQWFHVEDYKFLHVK